jgi:hypothetical protein
MENLFEDDEDLNLDRPTEEMERKKSFTTETAKPINVLVPRSKFSKAGVAVSIVARERENVLLCTMCGKNLITVVPAETMCGNCVLERKNLCVSKITTPNLTSNAPQDKNRAQRKGEGGASSSISNSSPLVKRRDMVDDQMGNPREALRYTHNCLAAAGWSLHETLPEEKV